MSRRHLLNTAIVLALTINTTPGLAACIDFDGSGKCIETGPVGNVPMPTGIERVGSEPSSSDRNSQQQEPSSTKKAPRSSGPSMKAVVTGTIVEGVIQGLLSPSSVNPARVQGKAVTSVTSPQATKIQRQLQEQDDRDFLRAKRDLVGGLKDVGTVSPPGTLTLKAVPPPDSADSVHSGFFGMPGAAGPTVGLLREPMNGAGEGQLLSPEEFKKAIGNPDLTQEERDRLFLRTRVAPSGLDDHPMVDSRAFAEKEHYTDLYLDVAAAGGKAAVTTVSLSLVDEAGKRVLEARGIKEGYDELLTAGKNGIERPKNAAATAVALGDYALTKAPTWSIAVDGAVNATGAMTRQAIVRYWAAKDSQQYYDPTPVATAKEKWNSWYADQHDWTKAALDRIGAGEYR